MTSSSDFKFYIISVNFLKIELFYIDLSITNWL